MPATVWFIHPKPSQTWDRQPRSPSSGRDTPSPHKTSNIDSTFVHVYDFYTLKYYNIDDFNEAIGLVYFSTMHKIRKCWEMTHNMKHQQFNTCTSPRSISVSAFVRIRGQQVPSSVANPDSAMTEYRQVRRWRGRPRHGLLIYFILYILQFFNSY